MAQQTFPFFALVVEEASPLFYLFLSVLCGAHKRRLGSPMMGLTTLRDVTLSELWLILVYMRMKNLRGRDILYHPSMIALGRCYSDRISHCVSSFESRVLGDDASLISKSKEITVDLVWPLVILYIYLCGL